MGPSTLMFMLRWYFVEFLVGTALVVCGICGLAMSQPYAPDTPLGTVGGLAGHPASYVLLVIGSLVSWNAWRQASSLRSGADAPDRALTICFLATAALGYVLWTTGLLEFFWELMLHYPDIELFWQCAIASNISVFFGAALWFWWSSRRRN